ncbi:MAG TPA: universal stress protein [Candidatus Binatia bacterium]|jgi:nucleotide-binding universal stress UspA family protein
MRYGSKRVLVGIEDSESSKRVLEYIADLASGNDGFVIHVSHAVGPVPPELREFRGVEDPKTERELDLQLRRRREEWIQLAKEKAQPLLQKAKSQLSAGGIPSNNVAADVMLLDHEEDFIGELLNTAAKNRCGTIVVGKNYLPWFKELFASHTGEELLKRSEGFAICVVQ